MEKHIIESETLRVEVSSFGAELQSIYDKNINKEYLWSGKKEHWARKSPVLFPFVGKLKDDESLVEGKLMKCSQHGFARDKVFELLGKTRKSTTFSLKYDDSTLEIYPYKYELIISYFIESNRLKVKWEVINRDDKTIYFSIGAHPAFNLPYIENSSLKNYYLEFSNSTDVKRYHLSPPYVKNFEVVKDLDKIHISPELFISDALVYSGVDSISIKNDIDKSNIKLTFSGFPFVGIWSPYYKDGSIAPFLCIEPWHGIADSNESSKVFKEKLAIVELDRDSSFKAEYFIEIN